MLKAKFDQIAEGNSNEDSGMSRYLLEAQLVFVFFPLYYNRFAEGGVFGLGGSSKFTMHWLYLCVLG